MCVCVWGDDSRCVCVGGGMTQDVRGGITQDVRVQVFCCPFLSVPTLSVV